jgi:hypothetical protein
VQDAVLNSGWDTIAVAVLFVVVLAFGIFRLDAIFAMPKSGAREPVRGCGTDEHGEPILCDPDGRPWMK